VKDLAPYTELATAAQVLFDRLDERRAKPRFMVPDGAGWRPVTWGAFADEVHAVATFLVDEVKLQPGERVAIFASNRVEWMSAALAAQAAGGVMVPIYPASTPAQAAYVAAHAEARVLFVDAAALKRVQERREDYAGVRAIVALDGVADAIPWSHATARRGADFFDRLRAVSLDQPGLMLYTSGTSGNPKGVPLSHRNIGINGADWLQCLHPIVPDDRDAEGGVDLLWLPMSHIFGLGEACLGNRLGWTSYLCDPMSVIARLPEVRPNVLMSVPTVWEKLAGMVAAGARFEDVTGGRLRFCLSGGAGLKVAVKERFRDAGVTIIEGYGLTECSPTLTLNRPDAVRFDSVGRPLPSIELRLADDGEILARGPSVFAGYHRDPEATRAAFTDDGWFQTGDVGRFTEDGFLQIVDRKKDILVTAGGKNVPPANIELRFRDDPAIAHVVVYGDGQRYLVAGVWLTPDAARLPGDEARAMLQRSVDRVNGELASYETIKKFTIIPEPLTVEGGMLTSTLKVRRKQVYQTFRAHFEGLYT
jgi:long-chain acyl-CoA synthetase